MYIDIPRGQGYIMVNEYNDYCFEPYIILFILSAYNSYIYLYIDND